MEIFLLHTWNEMMKIFLLFRREGDRNILYKGRDDANVL